MVSIDEKRVYADKTGATEVYVASDLGVTVVAVSADKVGEFTLAHRCTARDVAGGPEFLAVATAEDVLVGLGESFSETGFGPAVAVAVDGDSLIAAGEDGAVGRYIDGEWTTIGTVEEPRAIDGDLVAAADGVFRINDENIEHVGLEDVRDVATDEKPLAATGDGLYYLGPGWASAHDGAFEAVARAGERAHAATADTLYEQADDEWQARELPVAESVAGVAYGEAVYAVTEEGTMLVDAGDGWRSRSLGLRGVGGVAVGN